MDLIPIEVFYLIIGELPLQDLFNCKTVCKSWLNLIDGYYLKRIVITKRGLPYCDRSFESFDKIDHLNLVIKNDLLESELAKKMFINLKELSIYEKEIPLSFISKINCLKNLEQLDLFKLILDEDCELSLPKLITLNLYLIVQKTSRNQIKLITPSLTHLKLNQFKHAKIVYEDKIIRAHSLGYDDQLKNLINLESIKIDGLNVGDLEDDFLLQLEKLKVFDYEGDNSVFYELKKQIEFYGRTIRVYHYGMSYKSKPTLRVMNYDRRISGRRMIYYLDRMKRLADRLPAISIINFDENYVCNFNVKLQSKLIGIRAVNAMFCPDHSNRVEQSLECLLKHCNVTDLRSFYLNESFYSKLPYLTPFLNIINFGVENDYFDWGFLSKLKLLRYIKVNHCVEVDDLGVILKNLTNLIEFRSKIEENRLVKFFEFKYLNKHIYEFNLGDKKYSKDFKTRKETYLYLKSLLM